MEQETQLFRFKFHDVCFSETVGNETFIILFLYSISQQGKARMKIAIRGYSYGEFHTHAIAIALEIR
jgi:hypothetical protein